MKTLHEFAPVLNLTESEKRAIYRLRQEYSDMTFMITTTINTSDSRIRYRVSPIGAWHRLLLSTETLYAQRISATQALAMRDFSFTSVIIS